MVLNRNQASQLALRICCHMIWYLEPNIDTTEHRMELRMRTFNQFYLMCKRIVSHITACNR